MAYLFALSFSLVFGVGAAIAQSVGEPQPIIEHLRGNSAVHFQEVSSLKYPEKFLRIKREPMQDEAPSRKEFFELERQSIRVLAGCEQSISKQRKLKTNASLQSYDLLVLAHVPPKNYKELYGETVYAFRYDEDLKDGLSTLMLDLGTSCLPTRIRSDGTTLTIDTGKNALKNYSKSVKIQSKRDEKRSVVK